MASLGMILQAPAHEVTTTTLSEQGTTHQVASKGGTDRFGAPNHTRLHRPHAKGTPSDRGDLNPGDRLRQRCLGRVRTAPQATYFPYHSIFGAIGYYPGSGRRRAIPQDPQETNST